MLRSSGTVRLAARAACAATWPPKRRGRRSSPAGFTPTEDVAVQLLEVEHGQELGDVARLRLAPLDRCRRVVHAGNRRRRGRVPGLRIVGSDGREQRRGTAATATVGTTRVPAGRGSDRRRHRARRSRRRSPRPCDAGAAPRLTPTSVLDATASVAPFDTVVVVMMENRSFDHLLGWAGADAAYLDAGRQRYGADFMIDGNQAQSYTDAQGQQVATHWLPGTAGEQFPYQGCGEDDPRSRVERRSRADEGGVPRQGQRERTVRARLLRRVRHALHRADGATLHHRRPMVLVAARPDVPQPPVPARGAVGAPEARPGTADPGHVPHEDDLGQPAATPRCRRPTTTPTSRSRRCGGNASTTSRTR